MSSSLTFVPGVGVGRCRVLRAVVPLDKLDDDHDIDAILRTRAIITSATDASSRLAADSELEMEMTNGRLLHRKGIFNFHTILIQFFITYFQT